MRDLKDNLFIKRIEEGKDTGLMLMVHNAYWSRFSILERRYSNFHAYIFGSGTVYPRLRKHDIPKDCDFILLDGADYYKENEYLETLNMASKISNDNNKRVTIGYVYFIPVDERIDPSIKREIKITSIKDGNIDEEIIPEESYPDLFNLAEIIVRTHDSLEHQKVLNNNSVQ